jgi:hypothetical protein
MSTTFFIQAYSNVVLMKVGHIFDRVCFAKSTLYFSENINVFESTAAIYNGKIVDTGAKDFPLK